MWIMTCDRFGSEAKSANWFEFENTVLSDILIALFDISEEEANNRDVKNFTWNSSTVCQFTCNSYFFTIRFFHIDC